MSKKRLKDEMIARHSNRQSAAVRDGELVAKPLLGDSVAERRNRGSLGYHTDYFEGTN